MLISALLVAAIWPIAVTQDCAPNADAVMIGIAKNEAGKLIYCEVVSQIDEQSLKVSYLAKDKLFAEKSLHFSTSPFIPSVIQKDFRVGELRQADVSEKNVELRYQINAHKKIDKAVIPLQKVDILDAGFDNFIRKNWDELQSGKTLSVNFASMPHLKTLPLRISAQPLDKCLTKHDENSPLVCYFVEIDNALLRMLLGNIKITYDQHHRLYQFNGIVNLQDDDQDNQKAIIQYFYSSDYQAADK
jgi:hypothetical protein